MPDRTQTRKWVGVIRLSRLKDDTHSPERQRQEILRALPQGDQIVGWISDLDVSGSLDPWKRPEFAPWLSDNPPARFDGFLAYRIDRLSRRVIHFSRLIEWCNQRGITVKSATEPFDLDDPIGRAMAIIIAAFAEAELEAIRTRVSGTKDYLRRSGRWPGGHLPWWCEPHTGEDGRPILNPERTAKVREMIEWVIRDRMSLKAVARRLTSEGVLTARALKMLYRGEEPGRISWSSQSVRNILRNPSLRGWATHRGRIIRGEDGAPIRFLDPVIDDEGEWRKLQECLDESKMKYIPKNEERQRSPLRNVGFCEACGEALRHQHAKTRGRRYYRCRSHSDRDLQGCWSRGISADYLESLLEEAVLDRVGHVQRFERVVIPGEDWTVELESLRTYLSDLREEHEMGLFDYRGGREGYLNKVKTLVARIKELEEKSGQPVEDRVEIVRMEGTFGDYWREMTWDERNLWLSSHGVRVYASRASDSRRADSGVVTRVDLGDLEGLEEAAASVTRL